MASCQQHQDFDLASIVGVTALRWRHSGGQTHRFMGDSHSENVPWHVQKSRGRLAASFMESRCWNTLYRSAGISAVFLLVSICSSTLLHISCSGPCNTCCRFSGTSSAPQTCHTCLSILWHTSCSYRCMRQAAGWGHESALEWQQELALARPPAQRRGANLEIQIWCRSTC